MTENHLKSVIAKKFPIPRRQQKIIITVALILLAFDTILSTFTLTISDIVTTRVNSKTKISQLKSDESQDSAAGIHQQLEEEKIYKKRNQKIREVCKKVRTTRPVFVNNRKNKLPVSHWFTNRTNNCSLDMIDDEDYDEDVIMNTEMPNTSHFYISRAYRSMGCFPNKVASSSLLAAFLTERGLKPTSYASPHSVGILLQPKSMSQFKRANTSYFKFMFVRHPMRRILSCYIDKMNYLKVAIIKHARSNNRRRLLLFEPEKRYDQEVKQRTNGSTLDVTTKPSYFELNGTGKVNGSIDDANSTAIPTFEEFLEYVLSRTDMRGTGFDSHWAPYFSFCTPCSIGYHMIGKLETGEQDFKYVWRKTGLARREVPIRWFNRKSSSVLPQNSKIESNMERMYYSSLPRELILRFYSLFRLDFELFDYSIDEILLLAGYEPIGLKDDFLDVF